MSLERIKELTDLLNKASEAYYVQSKQLMGDKEFDLALRQLEQLEAEFPEHVQPNTPTKRVGSDLTSDFKKVAHVHRMESLQNLYNEEELSDFIKDFPEDLDLSVELKIDGVSLALVYEDRKLVLAVTRGDGNIGDNVTTNASTMSNIPLVLPDAAPSGRVEIRGECYMPTAKFEEINARLAAINKPPLANPRNAASGTIKTKNASEVYRRGLKFMAFGIHDPQTSSRLTDLKTLKSWGFDIVVHTQVKCVDSAILKVIKAIESMKDKCEYWVDGAVIKIDDKSRCAAMGSTSKHPRWAAAWKYEALQASTKLVDIVLQVGRTGAITPVATLEPVLLCGTTVKRATLHNFDEIKRLGLKIGDTILLEKGGEIIPKVVSVAESCPDGVPIEAPEHCPECGHAVVSGEDVVVRCPNQASCPAQVSAAIEHFCSKNCMDIHEVGPSLIASLLEMGFISTALDLYRVSYDMLVSIDKIGDKAANNVLTALAASKKNSLEKFIAGLGIRHIGKNSSLAIASYFGTLKNLVDNLHEVHLIPDMGEVGVLSLKEYLTAHGDTLLQLAEEYEINTRYLGKKTNDNLKGLTFVITGTLPSMDRTEMTDRLKACGAKVTGSVSKNTNYLVAGDNAGSKLEKAKSLGVSIISEEKAIEMMQ